MTPFSVTAVLDRNRPRSKFLRVRERDVSTLSTLGSVNTDLGYIYTYMPPSVRRTLSVNLSVKCEQSDCVNPVDRDQ